MSIVIPNAHYEQDVTIALESSFTVVITQRDKVIRMNLDAARAMAFVLVGMTDAMRREIDARKST